MKILILGATGFIGNSFFKALVSDYEVTVASRTPIEGYNKWRQVDFLESNDWDELLENIDLVINAIGIIEGDFNKVQIEAPLSLYKVCIEKSIKIIHISAIGAEKVKPATVFLETKKVTDDFLLQYDQARVIYPGIVIGKEGRSVQFFAEIAEFPIIPVFNSDPVPLIHIIQLCHLIRTMIVDFDNSSKQTFALSKPESLQSLLTAIRGKKALFFKMPESLFKVLFLLFPKAVIGIFDKATFKMLKEISMDYYEPLFDKASSCIDRRNIVKSDVFPQLFAILAISFIWIWSGLSSIVSWKESYALMQEIGASDELSVLSIWLGAIADIIVGIAVFWKKYRSEIIIAQMLLILTYMMILTIFAPHYWLHPFGVLSKNIPLIALSYYLFSKSKSL